MPVQSAVSSCRSCRGWISVRCIHVAEIVEPVFVRGVPLLGDEKQGMVLFF